MMNLKEYWTVELAESIELLLATIVNSVPGVVNAHGCSFHKYRDFKIIFDFVEGDTMTTGCYLEWVPENGPNVPYLNTWTGGLPTFYPKPVIDLITRLFSDSYQDQWQGPGADPWRRWRNVSEDQLRQIASQLSS